MKFPLVFLRLPLPLLLFELIEMSATGRQVKDAHDTRALRKWTIQTQSFMGHRFGEPFSSLRSKSKQTKSHTANPAWWCTPAVLHIRGRVMSSRPLWIVQQDPVNTIVDNKRTNQSIAHTLRGVQILSHLNLREVISITQAVIWVKSSLIYCVCVLEEVSPGCGDGVVVVNFKNLRILWTVVELLLTAACGQQFMGCQ